ncbi:MAG: zinc-ribbon domain-containing protein [Lachnospiraceae bacterium]|nr:zinc-ribbon domain-containing protein [Lachnospiraceae bacterium]
MSVNVYCIKCGTENPSDSKFCIACGAPLPEPNRTPAPAPFVEPAEPPKAFTEPEAPDPFKAVSDFVETVSAPAQPAAPAPAAPGSREPVCGWLVCTKGDDKGEDYRIRSKNNRIGGVPASDIYLANNSEVKSDNFATLAYYIKKNTFYLIPGDNADSISINGETIEIPTILNSGDIIAIGDSEYKFIPLCDDDFKWE